jgi:acyl-CoA thioesterase
MAASADLQLAPSVLRLHGVTAYAADWWRAAPRAFGGQIAAHLLLAAADAAPKAWAVHSLHVHFVREGQMRQTRYVVEPVRRGRSFALFVVRAMETVIDHDSRVSSERLIALGVVSFHNASAERDSVCRGPAASLHAAPMPHVPTPESQHAASTSSEAAHQSAAWRDWLGGDPAAEAWQVQPADERGLRWWMRWRSPSDHGPRQLPLPALSSQPHADQSGSLGAPAPSAPPESNGSVLSSGQSGSRSPEIVHAAALAFLSDLRFLHAAGAQHGAMRRVGPAGNATCRATDLAAAPEGRSGMGAAPGVERGVWTPPGMAAAAAPQPRFTPTMVTSLDHVLYLHAWPIDATQWMQFEQDSPHAANGRATVRARVWAQDGRLVASAVQEGVYRVTAEPSAPPDAPGFAVAPSRL